MQIYIHSVAVRSSGKRAGLVNSHLQIANWFPIMTTPYHATPYPEDVGNLIWLTASGGFHMYAYKQHLALCMYFRIILYLTELSVELSLFCLFQVKF